MYQGVSSTVATVEFSPMEIFRADDARADTPGQWRLSYRRSDEKKRQRNPSRSKAPVMNDVRLVKLQEQRHLTTLGLCSDFHKSCKGSSGLPWVGQCPLCLPRQDRRREGNVDDRCPGRDSIQTGPKLLD